MRFLRGRGRTHAQRLVDDLIHCQVFVRARDRSAYQTTIQYLAPWRWWQRLVLHRMVTIQSGVRGIGRVTAEVDRVCVSKNGGRAAVVLSVFFTFLPIMLLLY